MPTPDKYLDYDSKSPAKGHPWLSALWYSACALVVLWMLAMMTMDMNGNYPYLPERLSDFFTWALLGGGIAVSTILVICERGHLRFVAIIAWLLFAMSIVPAFLP